VQPHDSDAVSQLKPNNPGVLGGPSILRPPLQIVRPVFPDASRLLDAFGEALKSGQVTNNGRWVREFERQLADYLGVPTLAFCNGQLALMTMLRAAGIESGEVVVPSFTFAATPHAVRWCGAEPVFADIDPDTLCLDPGDVESRITPRTVAILGVDAYGLCCDYRALAEIGQRHGLRVLYDSAPSFGARVGGRLVGGFGDAQIFSFHATKAFATMEGGCLCSHDNGIIERAQAIRNFGQGADGDCREPGINGKLTEICALIGIEQLKTFDRTAERRRHAVRRMREKLEGIPGLTVAAAPVNQDPIWLYLPVVIDASAFGVDRDGAAALLERQGLYVRKYYSPPCHQMSAYGAARGQRLPVTEHTAANVLALPVYNDMTDAECDRIVLALRETRRTAQGENIPT
jgi:dTDP-4-amino-4,6-dideoxygalactose transaminase